MYAFSIIVVLECKFKFGTIIQIFFFWPKKANDIVNHFLWHEAKKAILMRCHYIFGKLGYDHVFLNASCSNFL